MFLIIILNCLCTASSLCSRLQRSLWPSLTSLQQVATNMNKTCKYLNTCSSSQVAYLYASALSLLMAAQLPTRVNSPSSLASPRAMSLLKKRKSFAAAVKILIVITCNTATGPLDVPALSTRARPASPGLAFQRFQWLLCQHLVD